MPDSVHSSARILVVDDNHDAADSLAILLELEGYAVRTAYLGHEALELAREMQASAVLLDLTLPDLDGYEVARRLRAREAAAGGEPRLLLVAISGRGSDSDLQAARAAGFDAHFLKPVSPESLLALLASTANKAR